VAPGASPPLHIHRREEEAFWVLEGRVRFRCGERDILAGPGSFLSLPRDIPHTFIVEGRRWSRPRSSYDGQAALLTRTA